MLHLVNGDTTLAVLDRTHLGAPGVFPHDEPARRAFRSARVEITPRGREALAGEADFVVMDNVERWLGGVRLDSRERVWRWDAERQSLMPPAP